MSSFTMASISHNAARGIPAQEPRRSFRCALSATELHRVARGMRHVSILSGTAWITSGGLDTIASCGDCVHLARTRCPVLISGLGGQPLVFEAW